MTTSASLSRWSSGFDTRQSRFALGIVLLFGVGTYQFYRMAVDSDATINRKNLSERQGR